MSKGKATMKDRKASGSTEEERRGEVVYGGTPVLV